MQNRSNKPIVSALMIVSFFLELVFPSLGYHSFAAVHAFDIHSHISQEMEPQLVWRADDPHENLSNSRSIVCPCTLDQSLLISMQAISSSVNHASLRLAYHFLYTQITKSCF